MSKTMAIVLNYNSSKETVKCANYLMKQQADLEICIVDNCSTDNSVDELEKYASQNQILFIANKENRGYSAGNNIGLKKADELGCKYALIINPDVEIRDRQYISKAVSKMDEDEKIAVLGTDIIINLDQHQNPTRELNFFEEVVFPYTLLRKKLSEKLPYVKNYKKSGYCEKLSGCCLFLNMDFVNKIGYLDENVFLYSEESILAAQIKEYGYKAFYMADLVAYHMHIDKNKSKNGFKMLFESRRYFINKTNRYGKLGNKIAMKSISMHEKTLSKKNS